METTERLIQVLDDEPRELNVEQALARVHASRHPGVPLRSLRRWPVIAFASLATVLIGQQALSLFEVRSVVPLRYPAGRLPFELMLPNVFPIYPANQVKKTRVANASEATAVAGFPVRALRSQLLPYPPDFRLEAYPTVERIVSRAKIEAALAARNSPPVPFPALLDGGRVALRARGWAVVSQYGKCPRLVGPWDSCAFLIQQNAPSLELPSGVAIQEFTEFSLRLVGLSEADARMLRDLLPAAPSLFLPIDDDAMLDVSQVQLRSGPATLVRYKPGENGQAFSMQWSEGGQLFTLMGRNPADAAAIANSLDR